MENKMTQEPGFTIKYGRDGQPLRHSDPEFAKKAAQLAPEAVSHSSPPEVEHIEVSSNPTQLASADEVHFEPQVEQEVEETVEVAEEEVPVVATKKADKSVETNMRALREKAERAEREAERIKRERDEMAQYLEEIRHQQQYHAQPQQQEVEEDYNISLGDEDLAEGKHLAKLVKKINYLESKLKKSEQQSSQMSVETRLKMQYPDLEKVLSQENIRRLREEEPELAYTISMNPDLYSQSVTAYKQIKKLGIHQEAAQAPVYDAEKQLIQKNAAKPRPVVSVNAQKGDSPLSRANAFANGLTEELKKQLQREMADIRKAY